MVRMRTNKLYQVGRGDGQGWSRLHVIQGTRTGKMYQLYAPNPKGAYDARKGIVFDEGSVDPVEQIVSWALENLTQEDIQRMSDAFNEATSKNMDEDPDATPAERTIGMNPAVRMRDANLQLKAQDRRPAPAVMDADVRKSYAEVFPNANRLKI